MGFDEHREDEPKPLVYLLAAVLFILALRGLSHPETARRGLTYGMVGMGLAILTTNVGPFEKQNKFSYAVLI